MNRRFRIASLSALLLGLLATGCPRDEITVPLAPPPDAPASPTAGQAPSKPDPTATERAGEPAPPMLRRAVVTDVTVRAIDAETGEDGSGNTVAAVAPVAIEISAAEWPVRALDPVLHVGRLHFHHYTFPRMNVLRFVAADASALPADEEAWVQYGDDEASRVTVTDRLEVPR